MTATGSQENADITGGAAGINILWFQEAPVPGIPISRGYPAAISQHCSVEISRFLKNLQA
jgi:hypothetical protein